MKTIIVPTDFSTSATNAASYALHIAKYLKSNLTLCHAFIVPVDVTLCGQMGWPLHNYETILDNSNERLDGCAEVLTRAAKFLEFPNTFTPKVEKITEAAEVLDLVDQVLQQKQASLVIAGMSGAGAVSSFFAGSNSRSMIENASFPLLLIPSGCKFKPIHKIAFATDLNMADIEVIHALVGFARYFDAEIVVVHVKANMDDYDAKKADTFLNELNCRINYGKVNYRELNSNSVNDGLQWLAEHGWVDMLVMVHRHNNYMDRLMKGSFTRRQAGSIQMPLLVLPEGLTHIF